MTAAHTLAPHDAFVLFDVARTLAWADGDLAGLEIAALRGLALALGLADMVEHGGHAIVRQVERPSAVRLRRLDPASRFLTASAATLVAMSDGTLDPREAEALASLAAALDLDPATARFARAHAAWVASEHAALPPHRRFARLLLEGRRRYALLGEAQRRAA